jgi:hypothetical protein
MAASSEHVAEGGSGLPLAEKGGQRAGLGEEVPKEALTNYFSTAYGPLMQPVSDLTRILFTKNGPFYYRRSG